MDFSGGNACEGREISGPALFLLSWGWRFCSVALCAPQKCAPRGLKRMLYRERTHSPGQRRSPLGPTMLVLWSQPRKNPFAPKLRPLPPSLPQLQPADPGQVPEGIGTPAAARKEYTGKAISLDLMDADLRNVLRLLSDLTGTNIVIEPDVHG